VWCHQPCTNGRPLVVAIPSFSPSPLMSRKIGEGVTIYVPEDLGGRGPDGLNHGGVSKPTARVLRSEPTPALPMRRCQAMRPVFSRPRPPALHGVKSPDRLATTSGGVVIVNVRPTGEPARTSCSAQGLPSLELDPASLPAGVAAHRTTQRRRSQGTKPRA
jgi:hypothetical protein